MIGHYDPFVQFDFGANPRRFKPFRRNDFTQKSSFHSPIDNVAEQTLSMMSNQSQEIFSGSSVIKPPETNRSSMLRVGIIFNRLFLRIIHCRRGTRRVPDLLGRMPSARTTASPVGAHGMCPVYYLSGYKPPPTIFIGRTPSAPSLYRMIFAISRAQKERRVHKNPPQYD